MLPKSNAGASLLKKTEGIAGKVSQVKILSRNTKKEHNRVYCKSEETEECSTLE